MVLTNPNLKRRMEKMMIGYVLIAIPMGIQGKLALKIHGYPYWFSELKQKKKGKCIAAVVCQFPKTSIEGANEKQNDLSMGLPSMIHL